jgi:hypothetical protein
VIQRVHHATIRHSLPAEAAAAAAEPPPRDAALTAEEADDAPDAAAEAAAAFCGHAIPVVSLASPVCIVRRVCNQFEEE